MSESENTEQTNTVAVNTNYARFAILLLAANFMLTGYAIASLIKIQEVATSDFRIDQTPEVVSVEEEQAQ